MENDKTKTKTILLVEDDYLNRRLSKKVLIEFGYEILEAKNSEDAITLLNKETIDFVLLDINLGKQKQEGISLGKEIKERYAIPFAYLSAYESATIVEQAIATSPYTYLTKPFKQADLTATVELGIQQASAQKRKKPSILVRDEDYTIDLPFDEICYLEAEGNYLLVYTEQKMFRSRCTIKQVLELLPTSSFIQTHRAFVVNKNKIDKFSIKSLMVNNAMIPVSKNYIDDVVKLLK